MRILLAIACILSVTGLSAETYRFNHYGETEGLPTQFIYTIDQASGGHLLVGTDVGLFSYDGYAFKPVFNADYKGADFIRCSYEDETGRFWYGHDQGIVTLLAGDEVTSFPLGEGITSRANQIVGGADGNVFVITQADGIFRIDAELNIQRFTGELTDFILYSGVMLGDDAMLVGSEFGLQMAHFGENEVTVSWIEGISETAVTNLSWDRRNHILVTTADQGLFQLDITREALIFEPLDVVDLDLTALQINNVQVDNSGDLFLSTNTKGLIRVFDRVGDTFRQFINFNEEGEMGTQSIQAAFHDRERNLWVGTIGGGLLKLVDHFFAFYDINDSEAGDAVHDVMTVGDTLWMSTSTGIVRALKSPYNVIDRMGEQQGLPEGGVQQLALSPNGDIWAGARGTGLFICKAGTDTFVPFELDKDLLSREINDILIEGPNIWVATYYGIFQVRRGKVFAHYSTAWGLPHNVVKSLFRDSQGRLWVATHNNDLTYIENGVQQLVVPQVSGVMDVDCFAEDDQGRIWVGTAGSGVLVVGPNQTTVLRKTEGLFNNNVYAMLFDAHNHMWLGHRGGITRVDATNFGVECFAQDDEMFFSPGAMSTGRNGMAWFGTSKGLLRYDPKQDISNPMEPTVHLLGINVSDSLYAPVDIIDLPYGAYKLEFDFVGVSFRKNEQLRYQYILEGSDSGWSDLTGDRKAKYNGLGSGTYTFKVTSFNNDGIGGKQVKSIRVHIGKPFWAKWWFYAVLALSLFVIIRFVVVRRETRIRANQDYLQRELDARTREVVEQKELLEIKNKDITDSIIYAKHIQRAIIPSPEKIANEFADSFVFYKPRDIVSGDFYWVERFQNKVVVACADCTGHGVPGAFMSLISSGILKQVAAMSEVQSPSDALRLIDMEMSQMLSSPDTEHSVRDGMDLSLVEYDFSTRQLRLASARRPVIIYQNGKRHEVRGDRFSIGGGEACPKNFELHTMQLRRGDSIYQFSDGITD